MELIFSQLKSHIPEQSFPIVKEWFEQFSFNLKITKNRSTKLGDYRASTKILPNRISVNGNLNQYAFLVTLTHEFAHLLVHEKVNRKVDPHGVEWKNQYAELLIELLEKNVFPEDLKLAIQNHIKRTPASSTADIKLLVSLKKYDEVQNQFVHLFELGEGTIFSLKNNRIFIKGEKRRTRFLCVEKSSQKRYLIHGAASVIKIQESLF